MKPLFRFWFLTEPLGCVDPYTDCQTNTDIFFCLTIRSQNSKTWNICGWDDNSSNEVCRISCGSACISWALSPAIWPANQTKGLRTPKFGSSDCSSSSCCRGWCLVSILCIPESTNLDVHPNFQKCLVCQTFFHATVEMKFIVPDLHHTGLYDISLFV